MGKTRSDSWTEVRTSAQQGIASNIFLVYDIVSDATSSETNQERLESLVFKHLTNVLKCNENIANPSLLDCYKKYCNCDLSFVKKYANITYSLFDKLYDTNSDTGYQNAQKHIEVKKETIDQIVKFYINKL